MDAELRYERNAVESSRTFDSVNDIISFDLSSGTVFNRLLWGVHFENEEIDNDGAASTRFRNVTAEAVYLITQKFGLKAVAGYDDNEFANSGESIDGPLWRLGGVWRPSRRTSLEATFGEFRNRYSYRCLPPHQENPLQTHFSTAPGCHQNCAFRAAGISPGRQFRQSSNQSDYWRPGSA